MAKVSIKELLINAAIDLFSRKRYLDSSIREIGEVAGVNPSLVYHYFKNKEEILFTIIDRFSRHLISSLEEIQSRESDPIEGLRKMIFQHLLFNGEFRKEVIITIEENTSLKGKLRTEVMSFQRKVYDIYMDQLKKLEQLDMLRKGNLNAICFSIFGIINWFYRWYRVGGQLNEGEIANQIIENIFSGILNSYRTPEGV